MDFVSAILDGILLGGLYGLFAAGLSLIFGVMRLVNIAHGDLIILSAYVALVVAGALGFHPLVCLVIVVPLMAALGYGLQRLILSHTLGENILPPLLVTFGLSVFLQNALLQIFSADSRRLPAGGLETLHLDLPAGVADRRIALLDVHRCGGSHLRIAVALISHRAGPGLSFGLRQSRNGSIDGR